MSLQIMQIKSDHERTKEKLLQAEKAAKASQTQLQQAYKKMDALEAKASKERKSSGKGYISLDRSNAENQIGNIM